MVKPLGRLSAHMPVPEGERDSDSKSTDEGGRGGGGGETAYSAVQLVLCAGAGDAEQKEVRGKMIYSNLQVGDCCGC